MLNFYINSFSLLHAKVQKDPGVIVGPISKVLGVILNGIFTAVNVITERHSLGISIIFFTLIVRALMIPLAVKQQKSMGKMQQLQPELDKIKKKYGDTKDPELQKKMNAEIQVMYSKSGANPLSGCLPLFIQFPIFISLNYCMQQPFIFISKLNVIYKGITDLIYSVPDWVSKIEELASYTIIPGQKFDIGIAENLMKVLNKFTQADWNTFFVNFSGAPQVSSISELLTQKNGIEFLFGINLLENPGYTFPAILLPILSAGTSFYSSWQMTKQQTKTSDNNSQMQQKIMLFAMPAMMLYFTFTMPAGVGLYWVASTIFQIFQQMVLNKHYRTDAPKKTDAVNIIDSKAIEKKSVKNKK